MKVIVCRFIRRQLDDAEINYSVSSTFQCPCPPQTHSGFFVVPCKEHTMFKRLFRRKFCFQMRMLEAPTNGVLPQLCTNKIYFKLCSRYNLCRAIARQHLKKVSKNRRLFKKHKKRTIIFFCSRETKVHLSLDDPIHKPMRYLKKFGN